jgi:hypothetical protein
MSKGKPIPGPLYAAAERILCGLGTADDRRAVLAAVPAESIPVDAAVVVVGRATQYGIAREVRG